MEINDILTKVNKIALYKGFSALSMQTLWLLFYTTDKPRGKPPETHENAIRLYLEGMEIRD